MHVSKRLESFFSILSFNETTHVCNYAWCIPEVNNHETRR